jgi:hypothetical protein
MRYLNLALVVVTASLAVSCAPPMTAYDRPKYGFAADFPAPPKVTDTTDPRTGRHITVFDARSLGRDFAVTVTDVDPPRPYHHLDIDQLADDASETTAKAVGGEVTYRTDAATAEGVLGRERVIGKDGRRAVRARYYLSGARLYAVTARSAMGLSPTTEPSDADPSIESGSDSDPAVKVFLTSFHVTPAAPS